MKVLLVLVAWSAVLLGLAVVEWMSDPPKFDLFSRCLRCDGMRGRGHRCPDSETASENENGMDEADRAGC